MRQIILDTETTGLSPKDGHRIIEIGCVEMINRRLTGNNFHHYINPERHIDAGAFSVHGISNQFVADKPIFSQLADDLIGYIDGAELVIHNAPFDVGFLDHELQLASRKYKRINHYCQILDTLVLARQKHPGQKNNLDALCKRYNVNNTHRDLHGALMDAEILAYVYLAMTGGQVSMFADNNTSTPGQSQTITLTKLQRQANTPIISASDNELKEHASLLKIIEKKSGGEVQW